MITLCVHFDKVNANIFNPKKSFNPLLIVGKSKT